MKLRSYRWSPRSKETSSAEWLAIYSPVFTSPEPAFPGPSGAHCIWASGSFVLSQATCERATLIHEQTPGLDHLGICLVLSGKIALEVNGAQSLAQPGDMALLDLHAPVRLIRGSAIEATSELTLWIPRTRLPAQLADVSAIHGQVVGADAPGAAVAAAALQALLPQLDATTAAEMDELVSGIVGLCARVVALSSRSRRAGSAAGPPPLESFVTVCRFVEANLGARDLGVDKLARTFGLSRASLYRLFEPVGGVASYIRTRRLARARQELTAPGLEDRRIGPIAYRAGFQSIPAFNRAFRAAYGQTPRSTRTTTKGAPTVALKKPRGEMGILARRLLEIS
jgi:AraC-like DNA-binding protein